MDEKIKIDYDITNSIELIKDENNELLPCPFCGSEEVVYDRYKHEAGERYRCICLGCMATVDIGYAQDKYTAKRAWNKRTDERSISRGGRRGAAKCLKD